MPSDEPNHTDRRFEALAESAPDAILTIDAQSIILSANAAVARIFGWLPQEVVGRPMTMLIPERLRGAHDHGVTRYLATGVRRIPWTGLELPGLTKDGREVPLEISFGEFVDAAGTRVFSGFVRDVSERVRQQQDLEAARAEAERAYRELARIGRITDVALARGTYDAMLRELMHRLREELDADAATAFLRDESTGALLVRERDAGNAVIDDDLAQRVVATGETAVIDGAAAVPVYNEGTVIGALHVKARRPIDDADVRLLGLVADRMAGVFARTRLFEAERAARHELAQRARDERVLRTLAQSITGAVHVSDVMHRIAAGALSVAGATGAFVEALIDDETVEIVAASGSATPVVGTRLPYPGSLSDDLLVYREPLASITMDGPMLVAALLGESKPLGALVLRRSAGEPAFEPGVIGRVRTLGDLASLSLQRITALAESERRRHEAEAAVRSRDEVLSVVSHDLRNPVTTVAMSASLLRDATLALTDEERDRQLGVIARSAHRMNRLIQDLLDVARIEGGRLTIDCRCIDAGTLATEACEEFRAIAAERQQTITCDVAPDVALVYVDRDRVLQALSNFLNNAVKFSPDGGAIALRVRATHHGVRFAVDDSGPGIDADDLPHLFERHWQAKDTAHLGSGLGLAIAQGIAHAHRGSVGAESRENGSTFWLELPWRDECGDPSARAET